MDHKELGSLIGRVIMIGLIVRFYRVIRNGLLGGPAIKNTELSNGGLVIPILSDRPIRRDIHLRMQDNMSEILD